VAIDLGGVGVVAMRGMKAVLTFGMMAFPVRVYAATEEHNIPKKLLHAPCGNPIKAPRTCPVCQVEVSSFDTVYGVKVGDGYVTLTEDDLDAGDVDKTVAIEGFAPLSVVPIMQRQKVYYLGPEQGAEKQYALLARVLAEKGVVGVGKRYAGGKEGLVSIETGPNGVLVLWHLFYSDEMRETVDIPRFPVVQSVEISDKEMSLAKKLLAALRLERPIKKITDETERRLQRIITAKSGSAAKPIEGPRPTLPGMVELAEQLQAALKNAEAPI